MTEQILAKAKAGTVPDADEARRSIGRPVAERPRYIDPAAEVMSENPNLSPPIHPHRD
jgi:hypothetical protein